MLLIPVVLAGAGILMAVSPDAAAIVSERLAVYVPEQLRSTSAALWFDGHASIGLMYLSGGFFFLTRTVTRLLDK
jgi:hypothetical protein